MDHAHIPESNFAVAVVFRAAVAGEDDYYFAGVNVENKDHRLSTHGEEGAIAALVTGLGAAASIVEGWVIGSVRNNPDPSSDVLAHCCGKCRQQIAGFAAPDVKIHSLSRDGRRMTMTVAEFLPGLFSFSSFMPDFVPAKPPAAPPSAADVEKSLVRKGPLTEAEIAAWLKSLSPVDHATKTAQSAVVKLSNGFYVAGTRVEDAAYIDISVAQSAMAVAAANFGNVAAEEAWIYTRPRAGVALPPPGLPLSALQVFSEFSGKQAVKISYLAGEGSVI